MSPGTDPPETRAVRALESRRAAERARFDAARVRLTGWRALERAVSGTRGSRVVPALSAFWSSWATLARSWSLVAAEEARADVVDAADTVVAALRSAAADVGRWAEAGARRSAAGPVAAGCEPVRAALEELLADAVPEVRAGLDEVARVLAESVDALHRTGVTVDGDPAGDVLAGTTAAGLTVVVDAAGVVAGVAPVSRPRPVVADTVEEAQSGAPPRAGRPVVDGSVAAALAQLGDPVVAGTGADARYRALVAELAARVDAARAAHLVQGARLRAVEDLVAAARAQPTRAVELAGDQELAVAGTARVLATVSATLAPIDRHLGGTA